MLRNVNRIRLRDDICHVKNGACDVGDEKRTESRYSNGKFQFGRFIWKTKTFSYERQLDENEGERESSPIKMAERVCILQMSSSECVCDKIGFY